MILMHPRVEQPAGGTWCPMRTILLLIFVVASFWNAVATADTGTYRILDYTVLLTPRSDGTVEIEYYQKWLVTGGHIPWITVGTPNSAFRILQEKNADAVSNASSASSGGWSGVRIDLDRDYKPNEVFAVQFAILQQNLFYADKANYRLDFTPGWYDRAEIDNLTLEVTFFAKIGTVTARPQPASVEGQTMTWRKSRLRPGEKFNISVSFPKTAFSQKLVGRAPDLQRRPWFLSVLIILMSLAPLLVISAIVLVIILNAIRERRGDTRHRRYGRGGTISYGGTPGAIRVSQGRRAGGGGGFGGRSVSCACACACVSCACACACAGGGGAGCDRKLKHMCPLCKDCTNENCLVYEAR